MASRKMASKEMASPVLETASVDWFLGRHDRLTPEQEIQIALEEMGRDDAMHLTTPVLLPLVGAGRVDLDHMAPVILTHLIQCFYCRLVLRQALDLVGAAEEHPAYRLLEDADVGARWQAAATTATEAAHQELLDAGIGYVYERDGIVYRRQPDGQEQALHPLANETEEQLAAKETVAR